VPWRRSQNVPVPPISIRFLLVSSLFSLSSLFLLSRSLSFSLVKTSVGRLGRGWVITRAGRVGENERIERMCEKERV
jgi:hypothetical protein